MKGEAEDVRKAAARLPHSKKEKAPIEDPDLVGTGVEAWLSTPINVPDP